MKLLGNESVIQTQNTFVAAAEQVRLEPALEHRQRRSWCDIAWQVVPHLCTSNRKSTTSDCWLTAGWNVKSFSGGGPKRPISCLLDNWAARCSQAAFTLHRCCHRHGTFCWSLP